MRTKLSALCDQFIEAGWLLALVVVPLFFDVYSSRVFEPDKLSLLRSIASLMVVAWLVREGEALLGRLNKHAPALERGALERWLRQPLVLPTVLLVLVYGLATVTSVVPRISLLGSYQRMQGLYSTLSYIVVFFLMLQGLRRQEQLERLVTTVILTSLPIALYGLLQHYQLDPLPWGGDVTFRVAANMGNAIFVGAYLIMVIPLTLARMVHLQMTMLEGLSRRVKTVFFGGFWVVFLIQLYAWGRVGFVRGFAASLLIIVALALLAAYFRRPMARFLLLGGYSMVLSAQVIALFFSQSRGPQLGLIAGLFLMGLFSLLARRRLAGGLGLVGAGLVLIVLLGLMNLPSSPLAGLRDVPYIGRLGRLLETEGGTGKVRLLIWEGAVDMLKADPARTLIGYGPESMAVAYTPFYPPDLAHYESRDASPDRSHNETFDALVMTGVIGFAAFVFLIGSLFYYGLSWLGLLPNRRLKTLFWACSGGGAVLGGLILPLALDHSLRFFGVGWPLGLVAGATLYTVLYMLSGLFKPKVQETVLPRLGSWELLLFTAVFAALIAHLIEIHFGIAIAATRTYFWAYLALLALLGQRLVGALASAEAREPALATAGAPAAKGAGRPEVRRSPAVRRAEEARRVSEARGKARGRRDPAAAQPVLASEPWTTRVMALGGTVAAILVTMFWDYTTNPLGLSNPFAVLESSLTTMAAKRRPDEITYGMFWLFVAVSVVAALVVLAELASHEAQERGPRWWLGALGRLALVAFGLSGVYGLVHATSLGPGVNVPNLIYEYYVAVLVLWLVLTGVLYWSVAKPTVSVRSVAAGIGYAGLVLIVLVLVGSTNVAVVKADIIYKQGLRYDQDASWDNAIYFYQQAIDTAPREDFYYLFLGRALMERAKREQDAARRDAYFEKALEALKSAYALNPLNTDHTANMGRLYRTWAEVDTDPNRRLEKLQQSLQYYMQVMQLSPHSAKLLNEWALVYYVMGDQEQALAKYNESLALDSQFVQTYLLIGDLRLAQKAWPEAIQVYQQAVDLDANAVQAWSGMGYAYSQLGQWDKAIEANLQVLRLVPQDYSTLKNLALLYGEAGRPTEALTFTERALALAPEQDKSMLDSYLQKLRAQLGKD